MFIIQYHKPKIYWISLNLLLIFLMVLIGGITRLTDSGLSMTEWSLVTGMIPPLTTGDWIEAFDKYKLSPEFTFKNYDMTIEEFKKIFFWEYFHRIWGRLIGLTYTLPLIYFWVTNKLSSSEKVFFTILLFFGASQAFMGWYMVKSGLAESPDVSHFRLSAHLFIAFLIYSMLLFYLSLKITLKKNIYVSTNNDSIKLGFLANKKAMRPIFEFGHLMGMHENKYQYLADTGSLVNTYIPYGPYSKMLPYLSRRMYENLDMIKYMVK